MGLWFRVAQAVCGLNVVILLGLASVWVQNYRELRSKHALGLSVFAALMLAENGTALYFYLLDPRLSSWYTTIPEFHQLTLMVLRLLVFGSLVVLAWLTWD